jgi:4-hydroxy-2,2'-bipyrrole-5-carbaldehyde O-methyltransferase
MSPTVLFALLRSPGLSARLRLRRELRSFLRLQFLAVALETGLLDLLRSPMTIEDLADHLQPARPDTLVTLLDLGVALGELRCTRMRYRLRSRTSRALSAPTGAALRAGLLELVDYHAAAFRSLPGHLLGGSQEDFLASRGMLIARSSRLVEPVVGVLMRGLVSGRGTMRILELGCGSGVYLRHASEANAHAMGVGVEIDPEVANAARDSLSRWGLAERFSVTRADARRLPPDLAGNFDLITLYNNIYYVAIDERGALFEMLRARLAPGGRLVLVSMMRGATPASLGLSLVLAGTRGCTALPTEDELMASLRQSGFTRIARRRLLPGEPLAALIATFPS